MTYHYHCPAVTEQQIQQGKIIFFIGLKVSLSFPLILSLRRFLLQKTELTELAFSVFIVLFLMDKIA